MHHMYPLAKGDPLCPLGFHPQVRWPTRCKRCFRDYKEHGGKKRDDSSLKRDSSTASTPSLSFSLNDSSTKRNWVSSTNLSIQNNDKPSSSSGSDSEVSSWISTPDLANLKDDMQATTTVSIRLPKRKPKTIDTGQRTESPTVPTTTEVSDSFSILKDRKPSLYNKEDSLATRAKKLQAIKEQTPPKRRIQVKEVKTATEEPNNHDVQFLIQVRRNYKQEDSIDGSGGSGSDHEDTISNAGTETTDTTLVGVDSDLRDQLESLKNELDVTKAKCDRLEREKSDILLRRLAAMETTTSKTTATEVLKLQQKCNEMQQTLEDLRDEKRSLTLKVKEQEADLDLRPTAFEAQKIADDLKSKLLAAETLCEELMDENEDMKKELRDMEEQIDEMQDNFREDQAVEYTSIKKELDQTTKNCRILSFKLRKTERRAEQLEFEKSELEKKINEISGSSSAISHIDRIKKLEQDLRVSNEVSLRLQKELEESNRKFEETQTPATKKKHPLLKNLSEEGKKISRDSLTRGGSQEDPAQLLRDLQDSLEREADLREQLKFSEEEGDNLRKKVSRIEEDNESLVLQLKKMASRARSRKLSPTNQRLTPEPQNKHDASDDEDPTELKLHLELSEQEASVLRKKIEELEADNRRLKFKNKELQDKWATKGPTKKNVANNDSTTGLDSQKVKILEDEINELRKKLIEKERDCERLHAEISLNQKRSKTMVKSKSLEQDQQTQDLKRQLQVIEQEASVLRSKVQSLETENEKLSAELKKLSLLKGTMSLKADKNIEKYIDKIASLEIELSEAKLRIQDLEKQGGKKVSPAKEALTNDFKKFSSRTPKKISALTSRDQLKTMVSDLEKEICEILNYMKNKENERTKLEDELRKLKLETETETILKDLAELNKKFDKAKEELKEEKSKRTKENKRNEELTSELSTLRESLEKSKGEKKRLKDQIEKLNNEQKKIIDAKKELDDEITKLKSELRDLNSKKEDVANLNSKLNSLKGTLEERNEEIKKLQKKADNNSKLTSENTSKDKKISDLQAQLAIFEDKCSDYDRNLKDVESRVESEKLKYKNLEQELATAEDDRKKLSTKIDSQSTKIKRLEKTVEQKDKTIKQLEENLAQEKDLLSKTSSKVDELETKEMGKLRDELSKKNILLTELESKLELSNNNKMNELEIDLQNEKKKIDVLKANLAKEHKERELEQAVFRSKIKKLELSSGGGVKKELEIKHFQETIEKLEESIAKERQKYDDLTAKYEILEEEHVVTKAKLVMDKQTLENQQKNVKKEMAQLELELKTLRDTYNTKQDAWIKEKLEMDQRIKELSRISLISNNDYEKKRLKALLEEKQSEFEQIKKEYDAIHDQMEYMRRENDELKKKLDDYEKVSKIQRNISADSSALDKEMKQLRVKLNNAEKSKKTDLAECKMRYESQLSVVSGEIQSLQNQLMRFKRERDNYKHMLESAQKTIGELKMSPKLGRNKTPTEKLNYDELEESKHKVASLEQQISCMEDELSEARLESSRLKTELVSERSSWEIKLSELRSKVNELEEERILNSGRTKIMGLRTRMELAWQKEREEQQRLLQETATLARDLRQTLFEVERERDKERLEAKRKQDQLKKSSEEEQEETKRKISELQCDLLELRDAHAKLRTTNEKLRREKERYDSAREEFRQAKVDKRKGDIDDDRKVSLIIEQVDTLKQLAPELFFSKEQEAPYTPTPPRRTKSRSRESSPALDRRETSLTPDDKKQRIQYIMQKLVHTTEDLRKAQRSLEDEDERERLRRIGMRRATSTEAEYRGNDRYSQVLMRKTATVSRSGSLYRKSLSLEQTNQAEQNIWRNENNDSLSSLHSVESDASKRGKRDSSLDSRLSGGSTQSDVGEKKKKSLIGKLKKLTKSRSIDDNDPGTFSASKVLSSKNNSSSDVGEERGSKKDLKDRITGIFKRGGSSSRSNSVERKHETTSTQRPLVRNGSNGNVTSQSSGVVDLMENLWKQDVDLGFSLEDAKREAEEEYDKKVGFEKLIKNDSLFDYIPVKGDPKTELKEEKKEEDEDLWAGIDYTIDAETGECVINPENKQTNNSDDLEIFAPIPEFILSDALGLVDKFDKAPQHNGFNEFLLALSAPTKVQFESVLPTMTQTPQYQQPTFLEGQLLPPSKFYPVEQRWNNGSNLSNYSTLAPQLDPPYIPYVPNTGTQVTDQNVPNQITDINVEPFGNQYGAPIVNALTTSMNLSNNSETIIELKTPPQYEAPDSTPLYQGHYTEAQSNDFLSTILTNEDLELMDMAMNEVFTPSSNNNSASSSVLM